MKLFHTLVLNVALAATFLPVAQAQQDERLLKELSAANDRAVDAWRHHDREAFAAAFVPDALYVSADGTFWFREILDGLMTCTVGPISSEKQEARSISPDVAVLVSRQHQQVTCMGHQEPADLNSSQTFVRVNGQWRVALRTDTPAHP